MLKKLVPLLLLVAVVVLFIFLVTEGGCRGSKAQSHEPGLAFDRWWQAVDNDRDDLKPTDFLHGFVLWGDAGAGALVRQSSYVWLVEFTEVETKGSNRLGITFPQFGRSYDVTYRAWTCHDGEYDYCLEVRGLRHRPVQYRSKEEWNNFSISDLPSKPPYFRSKAK